MAIDTSMFAAQIPAATYSVGDKVTMGCIRGPAIVRDGYGEARLKRMFSLTDAASTGWVIRVKNSNWIDEISNPAPIISDTTLDNNSGAVQAGNDARLVPNSGWQVIAECVAAGTEAAAADIICLIDVDYPSVTAVQDPKAAQGVPVTIDGFYTINQTAKGAIASGALWNTFNVDIFKAGFKYLLSEISFLSAGAAFGFISVSNAAPQRGLERIIPVKASSFPGLRYNLDYSTPLVKGPMNVNFLACGSASGVSSYTYMDFVRREL